LKKNKLSLKIRTGTIVLVIFALALVVPSPSSAATLLGDSSTYLQSRETTDATKILSAYEYLDFDVQNLGNETISFHTGGWLRYDVKNEGSDNKTNNDIQYSYLSLRSKTANSTVNLGRVMVFEGLAAERVDGAYAHTDLRGDFGMSAYAGVPVETTDIDLPGNSLIYGAHLTQQSAGLYRIGVSYLKEEKNSEDFRKEEGIDLWVHPLDKVEINGRSNYNAATKEWMENTYNLILGSFGGLRLITDYSAISYKDYFIGATTAVFRLKAGILDPNEKASILGETASYDLTTAVNVSVDYKSYSYDIAGNAKYLGGNLRYSVAQSGGAGLSYHRMEGDTDKLKYNEYRAYVFKKMGKTDLAIDVIDVKYDTAVNGVTSAYSASLAAQYDLTESLKVGADVEYSKNPDFDKDVRAFLKAIYRFDAGTGARKGA